MISLTKSLASELGEFNITVNCVAPGWVITDMTTDSLTEPDVYTKVLSDIPLNKIAQPEEIAGPVLFLASQLASHITGEILNVNGGSVLCG
jgi:3-oxoacyl-[acyl-carrier protein] reductase